MAQSTSQNSSPYWNVKEKFRNYLHKKGKGEWYSIATVSIDFMSPT